MKYLVKRDFDLDVGKKDPIVVLADGEPFVPAKLNIPLSTVQELVNAGTLELIRPEPEPKSDPPDSHRTAAKRK